MIPKLFLVHLLVLELLYTDYSFGDASSHCIPACSSIYT